MILALAASGAAAQDENALFDLGGDRFMAGQSVSMQQEGRDDVFLAGERVSLSADIAGTAHMAGRWLTVTGAVGEGLYAAGQEITVEAPVGGDATLAGQRVDVTAPVAGDLRIFGSEIGIAAPVEGTLLAAGEFVEIDGAVAGDASMAARTLEFGPEAAIAGTLTLYEDDPGTLEVPEGVIPEARIERREIEEWEHDYGDYAPDMGGGAAVVGFVLSVLLVAVLAACAAVFMPGTMAAMRARVLEQPLRTIVTGFVTQSALIGAAILLGMTLIGLLLTPAAIFLAIIAGLAGYIAGAYALGVGVLSAFGRDVPDSTGDRALAAITGALVAAVVALIPLLGWIAVMVLTLAGIGAVTIGLFRPRLFAD
ncbi:hypothetical protein Salmuc_01413 [Salipiger mucosus DSM 16094]|uniref:DUF8173 domain-containing protein n=1 Tax=Salipiger mucosus DSM 16094 TaxID=1123237 RepID=S9S9C7_9RHOB|nr:hypothetical protein Salmuc_01413 [Salipiger mucosus DSM 16094]